MISPQHNVGNAVSPQWDPHNMVWDPYNMLFGYISTHFSKFVVFFRFTVCPENLCSDYFPFEWNWIVYLIWFIRSDSFQEFKLSMQSDSIYLDKNWVSIYMCIVYVYIVCSYLYLNTFNCIQYLYIWIENIFFDFVM